MVPGGPAALRRDTYKATVTISPKWRKWLCLSSFRGKDTALLGNNAIVVMPRDAVVSPTVQTAGGFPRVAET